MKTLSKTALTAVALLALASACVPALADDTKIDEKKHDEVITKAVAFLKTKQAKDGSWSKEGSDGVTGVVAVGLFQSG